MFTVYFEMKKSKSGIGEIHQVERSNSCPPLTRGIIPPSFGLPPLLRGVGRIFCSPFLKGDTAEPRGILTPLSQATFPLERGKPFPSIKLSAI
jgi:hypothetical protein